jgi:hypothetical protein
LLTDPFSYVIGGDMENLKALSLVAGVALAISGGVALYEARSKSAPPSAITVNVMVRNNDAKPTESKLQDVEPDEAKDAAVIMPAILRH